MARYLFVSHDGFGLGHVKRNCVIAEAVRRSEPAASITVVTGIPSRPPWLERWGRGVVRVPPLLKDGSGQYRPLDMTYVEAVARRGDILAETVDRVRPDVVVVDRHPFGIAGEFRPGLEAASFLGARLVLGLRDVLDEPGVVIREMQGEPWAAAPELFGDALVYGARHFCDHQQEYHLTIAPTYCGWVVERPARAQRDPQLLAAAAGGGGDGAAVFRLATEALLRRPSWRGELVAGPFGDAEAVRHAAGSPNGRLKVHSGMSRCRELLARAGAVVQMAGYNSTFEALAAGQKPILVPRRAPRREQAIRAERLSDMGLADVVESDADPDELVGLLDRPRSLEPAALARAGVDLTGAEQAAAHIRRAAEGANAA
jgi:predicted glycosyltransferase